MTHRLRFVKETSELMLEAAQDESLMTIDTAGAAGAPLNARADAAATRVGMLMGVAVPDTRVAQVSNIRRRDGKVVVVPDSELRRGGGTSGPAGSGAGGAAGPRWTAGDREWDRDRLPPSRPAAALAALGIVAHGDDDRMDVERPRAAGAGARPSAGAPGTATSPSRDRRRPRSPPAREHRVEGGGVERSEAHDGSRSHHRDHSPADSAAVHHGSSASHPASGADRRDARPGHPDDRSRALDRDDRGPRHGTAPHEASPHRSRSRSRSPGRHGHGASPAHGSSSHARSHGSSGR